MAKFVESSEDRFSRDEAQIMEQHDASSRESMSLGFPTSSDTNHAVQSEPEFRNLKLLIYSNI